MPGSQPQENETHPSALGINQSGAMGLGQHRDAHTPQSGRLACIGPVTDAKTERDSTGQDCPEMRYPRETGRASVASHEEKNFDFDLPLDLLEKLEKHQKQSLAPQVLEAAKTQILRDMQVALLSTLGGEGS